MAINVQAYQDLQTAFTASKTQLIAVSKTKPVADIEALYALGQRDFGENYVQELVEKQAQLPADIRWHFIGHLQSNKVKYIAPFVHLIHGVDSLSLLKEINKQAIKSNRIINSLLQIHIAQEETKFGLNEQELIAIYEQLPVYPNVHVIGYMGMASFTDDPEKIRTEFQYLKSIAEKFPIIPPVRDEGLQSTVYRLPSTVLSMGMSADYQIAIEEGGTHVRIGSLLFGSRG
jgi:PLP dependent protein